ncbi:MAG: DUF4397 domain-containing protein [Peptostreptococcaceae bacterium]|nr:DUF4397 domain-containing protein [Peptostreptococcaceae bacterium]
MDINLNINNASIRVFHAIPGAPAVDVYSNGTLLFENISYKEFTPYIVVPKGRYYIKVYATGTTTQPLIEEELQVQGANMITVAATGSVNDLDDLELVPYVEANPNSLTSGKSKVRAIHLSPDAPDVDVLNNGNVLFGDLEFRDATNYAQVNPGQYNLGVAPTGTTNVVLPINVNLKENKIYTIYVIGELSNLEYIQSLDGSTYMRIKY